MFYWIIYQVFNFLGEIGLGLLSEQAGESIHREFILYWNPFKAKSIENSNYLMKSKTAVVEFSSQHLQAVVLSIKFLKNIKLSLKQKVASKKY